MITENLRRVAGKSKAKWSSKDGAITLLRGDCCELLPLLAGSLIDCVVTDPPYGCTDNAWDRAPDLDPWWSMVRAATKPEAVSAVFCQQPFTTSLICSNRRHWRYELVWHKPRPTGFLNAKLRPLRCHEHIQVFSAKPTAATYNPQMGKGKPYRNCRRTASSNYGRMKPSTVSESHGTRYPRSVLMDFPNSAQKGGHPTQKPLSLIEWLVRTYSNAGDVVLDPYMGSGTTAEACLRSGRRFIGIEQEERYFTMAIARLTQAA